MEIIERREEDLRRLTKLITKLTDIRIAFSSRLLFDFINKQSRTTFIILNKKKMIIMIKIMGTFHDDTKFTSIKVKINIYNSET